MPGPMLAARSSLKAKGDTRLRSDDVRFGSKADIRACVGHVRFTPESGHSQRRLRCPLSANSGHHGKRHVYSPSAKGGHREVTRLTSGEGDSDRALPIVKPSRNLERTMVE